MQPFFHSHSWFEHVVYRFVATILLARICFFWPYVTWNLAALRARRKRRYGSSCARANACGTPVFLLVDSRQIPMSDFWISMISTNCATHSFPACNISCHSSVHGFFFADGPFRNHVWRKGGTQRGKCASSAIGGASAPPQGRPWPTAPRNRC